MFRYYLLLAWRIMKRQKIYTAINVLGLAIGVCACLVIYLVTSYDLSFDRFHKDGNRIFRITGEVQRLSGDMEFVNSVIPDVAGIETAIPGFESKAAIYHYDAVVKKAAEGKAQSFTSDYAIVTAPDYFKIFDYVWLAGDPGRALNEPNSVVISEKRARLYFADQSMAGVIGRTLVYNDSLQLTVTGVVEDWKQNTDLPYTDFISLSTASNPFLKKDVPATNWSGLRPHGTMAFVKIDKNTTSTRVNELLKKYLDQHPDAAFYGKLVKLELQSIKDLHFTKVYNRDDDGDRFRKAYLPVLYLLMGIAVFILILAVVNFVNLSTALSIKRSKEIGMRKVLGVSRKSLAMQLFTETFLFTAFAVAIACFAVNPVIKLFSNYIPDGISFTLKDTGVIMFLIALTVLTTFLSGVYPAKVLSSLMPVLSLKGISTPASPSNTGLRKGLIVFQFTVSLIFIIGTLVINEQIRYMRTKDKGFKTDAIITVNNWGSDHSKMQVLAQSVKNIPGVENAILEGDAPMGFMYRSGMFKYKEKTEGDVEVMVKTGDEHFIPFYHMKLIAGRNLHKSDSAQELVINEVLARKMGFTNPADGVGKVLYSQDNKAIPIVGIVADFHMSSFLAPIRPMVIQHVPDWETSMAVNIASSGKSIDETKKVIASIEKEWKLIFPESNFDYSFLDDSIARMFEKEKQSAWLMNAAMIITIFISCMGLFGLAMYTAQTRKREIGIRKVIGASVLDITAMLTKDFGNLVLLATVIATPVAWLIMNSWLQDFAYRTNISVWVFIAAMIIALMVAMITVSYQSIKAAMANPVENLRSE
jgi:ABC-type antimicrobial peptide transport system permease subunit